ncbi:phage tail protein [Burkholderia gladioli]|uniref:phage tail protein n=1 Tax=Burkholderia gladioli TaxID=28095 RepID=UPI003EDED38D
MINVYDIGTTLKLVDRVSPELLKLSREFSKVDALALQLGKRLQKVGAEAGGVRNVAAASKALDSSLKAVGNQAALAERNLRGIKGAIPTGKIGIEAELTAANVQAKTLATTLAGMRGGRWLPGPGGGGGGGGGAGRGGHGGRIHGGNLHFGSHGIGIGGVGMGLMSDALVPLGAAMVAGYVGKQFYESAKDLQTEHARFKLFGMDDAQNKSAFDFAHNLHAYATSENEAMHYMNEAQAVFRESGETGEKALAGAKMAAPFLAKMMAASSILSEESQAKLKHESMAMLRTVDLQGGGLNPELFSKLADFGFRMTQTSGGQINWEQLRQMFRTGGLAVQRMDENALAELEPIIGEFKGSSFATAMRTAYNRMNGVVKPPNQAVHELINAGIWDRSKVVLNDNGGIKKFLGNPLRHADEYSANAAEYYFKYVRPYYEKQKYNTSERDRMNAMLFGGTGGNLFSKIDQQEPLIRHAGEAFKKTRGLDQALDLAKDTATGAEKDFGAAWTDFKTQFGNSMLPQVTEILRTGTEVLRAIAAFANSDAGKAIQSMGSMITGAAAWPWHLIGSMFGGDKQATPDPTVPKKDASTGNVHTTINLDGRKIAQAVTPYMAGALGSGMYGLGVDPTVAVPMPGIKGG